MTDDITRGLTLLADEAEATPIDTHAVIARAKARTRNRRATTATAFAVTAIGALAIGLTSGTGQPVQVGAPPADRAERLNQQLADVRADAVPEDWRLLPADVHNPLGGDLAGDEPLTFECGERDPSLDRQVCQAIGQFDDGGTRVGVAIQVLSGGGTMVSVPSDDRTISRILPDRTRFGTHTAPGIRMMGAEPIPYYDPAFAEEGVASQLMSAFRPGGTSVILNVIWVGDPSAPPFTEEQLQRLATAFTY
ncbi:hypothetical protein [Actinophytocola glycyrrhizae]|uniref:DUF5642 domain-containing protein n=1 Tax=Actinophytocola glycyrrhizae TaxID=2044873 RepID=A0ABV9RZD3_9PSEU